MKIWGDSPLCDSGDCQYFRLSVSLRPDSVRAVCPSHLDPDLMFIELQSMNSDLHQSNFHDPWQLFLTAHPLALQKETRKNVQLVYNEHNLATTSHGLGFGDVSANDDRLVFKEIIWDSKDSGYTPIGTSNTEILVVNYYTSLSQHNTDRSYVSLLDVVGNLGGLSGAIFAFVGLAYGWYLDKTLRDDLVHKA